MKTTPVRGASRRTIILFVVLISLLLAGAAWAAGGSTQPNPLEDAQQRAAAFGSYTFTADVEQRLIPHPTAANIGESDQRLDLRLEGEVTLPDHARMVMRFEGAGADSPEIELIREGHEVYLLQDGALTPMDDPAGFTPPTADYLSYLNAAENVTTCPDGADHALSCYAYDINGRRFADQVLQELKARIERGEADPLPVGVELSPPPLLRRMTGHGSLWVDTAGLPLRQIVELEIPNAAEGFDAHARIVVDFTFADGTAGHGEHFSPASLGELTDEGRPAPLTGLFTAASVVATLVLLSGRRRRLVYGVVALLLSTIMVFSPLLQALGIHRFQARQAEAATLTTITEALGLPGEAIASPATAETDELLPSSRMTALERGTLPPQTYCGAGDVNLDSDGDGLNDAAEACLGTDPFYGDSDRDLLTDTLEIEGFLFDGRRWYSDAFKADSNGDGLADFAEWPAPIGDAPNFDDVDDWDPDGDGIPNLWDPDNDGDGVPDHLDLSPFTVTDTTDAFSLRTRADFDGYQYIEVQVQPENSDHLRYTTSTLDWPYDDRGQIQNPTGSTDNLQLAPFLKIRTRQRPGSDLAQDYGVSIFAHSDDTYDLYAPLLPVGDGGQIVAFYSKVAYGPDQLHDIEWQNAQMVWIVLATMDGQRTTPIQTYTEPSLRVTGLQITKSRGFESAILGTPDTPDNDQALFNVFFGLSATFLNTQAPDLAEVKDRFSHANTDIVQTWGVPADQVTVDATTYAHADAGLAGTQGRIADVLKAYPTESTPSLIIAYTEELGVTSMDALGSARPAPNFDVHLDPVDMGTQRSLRRATYAYAQDSWDEMPLEDTLLMLHERHEHLDVTLAELQVDYPELTLSQLEATLALFYTLSHLGQMRVVAVNGNLIAPDPRSDLAVYEQVGVPANHEVAYLIAATGLGEPGAGLRIGTDQAQIWSYQRSNEQTSQDLGIGGWAGSLYDLSNRLLPTERSRYIANVAVKSGKTALSVMTAVQCIQWATRGRYFGLTGWTKVSKTFGWTSRMKLSIRVLGVIGLVASLAIIWVQFGLTTDFSDPLAVKQAVTHAVVATAFTVLLFVISLNPIGAIIVGLLVLVDLIVFVATGGELSLMGEAITAVATFFYDVTELTFLDAADFSGVDGGFANDELGSSQGNRFRIGGTFIGDIDKTSSGSSSDLRDSYVYGEFKGSAASASAANKNGSRSCASDGVCRNAVMTEFALTQARRDVELKVEALVRAKVYYEECVVGGLKCWRSSNTIDLPEDLDKEDRWDAMTIVLDVLPDSLSGLWTWNQIVNRDPDGDGLLTAEELNLNLDPRRWDTDGDGLSDAFEVQRQASLGTHPSLADTDGDGLPDGLEYRLGTGINNADSDGDGLTDGEEVYHRSATGEWGGGWTITLPGWSEPVMVFSDPLAPDTDGDGLDDAAERANRTSPYAYNHAPQLTLDVHPSARNPNGAVGAYVRPGETVVFALTLAGVGPQPVTGTLSLCLPPWLGDVRVGPMVGDRTPPHHPAGACDHGVAWSFAGGETLQLWESVGVVVTTTVSHGIATSTSAAATAVLPTPGGTEVQEVTARALITLDLDRPDVAFIAPLEGALLGGGTSTYVVGGTSYDPTSWVTHVEVDLPGGATVTPDDVSPWTTTWDLPSDGVYTLRARAHDALGHPSDDAQVRVTVDNTPPTIDLALAEGDVISGLRSDAGVITITLTGNAGDNLAGLRRVQLRTNDRPWREVWTADEPGVLSGAWEVPWVLPDEASAQGTHTVEVRAFDHAGNRSPILRRSIVVDVVPPTSELTHRSYLSNPPHTAVGQPHTLHGVANDVGNAPQPSRPAELVGTLHSIRDATLWLGLSSIHDNDGGVTVTWAGDLNGDRLADLVIGLPASDGGAGRVAVIYGRAGDWPTPDAAELVGDSRTSWVGQPGASIGAHVVAVGDVNGDGFDDLLVGDPVNNRAFLIFGHPAPLGRDRVLDGPQSGARVEILAPEGEQLGAWLGAAGDVNGDGYHDLLIGTQIGGAGTAYLLLGRQGAWWETMALDVHAAARIEIGHPIGALAGVGDADSDAYDDFVIAGGSELHLFAGHRSFTAGTVEALTLGEAVAGFSSVDAVPSIAALGDVDGDGYADFAFSHGTTPKLVLGQGDLSDAGWRIHTFDRFSPAPSGFLAGVGDVDADGLADLLLGTADDNAYLILGGNLNTVAATLTGVASAAQAPFAAGADLNSDGASDLLLVPHEATAADLGLRSLIFGPSPRIHPDGLPVAPAPAATPAPEPQRLLTMPRLQGLSAAPITVDAGGGADYTTLQEAVDAAPAGATIEVRPGVYAGFIVADKANMTISGTHPDAVFIDGGDGYAAVEIRNASGITISRMTLRHAIHGVYLEAAGVGGYETPALATLLDTLLIHDVSEHAVAMDRTSSVELRRCTLVGLTGHLEVYGAADAAFDAAWTTGAAPIATAAGGGMLELGESLYLRSGGGSQAFYRYTPSTATWQALADTPTGVERGSLMAAAGADEIALVAPHWDPWGSAMPHDFINISSVAAADAYVYVAGTKIIDGGPQGYALARWDGAVWTEIPMIATRGGDPARANIADIVVDSAGRLYIGGLFDRVSGVTAVNVAMWDGATWHALEGHAWGDPYGPNLCNPPRVEALALDAADRLLVGGCFANAGSLAVSSIARWNGTGWDDVFGAGIEAGKFVYALAADGDTAVDGTVYVGGSFSTAGGVAAGSIARWSPTGGWAALDNGVGSGHVRALALGEGRLYVGGSFSAVGTAASPILTANLAWWDGSWHALSSNTDGMVRALAAVPGGVFAAGDFSSVDGQPAHRVAQWTGTAWTGLISGGQNGVNGWATGLDYRAGRLYVVGQFDQVGGLSAAHRARWSAPLHRYHIPTNTWSTQQSAGPFIPTTGAALTGDDNGDLYALPGGRSPAFYRYTWDTQVWEPRAGLPSGAGPGSALTWAAGSIYTLVGNTRTFCAYSPQGDSWDCSLAQTPATPDDGAALSWDGRDWIYAVVGGNGRHFLRYHIPSDRWQTLGDGSVVTPGDADTPSGVRAGGAIARIGSELFGLPGGGAAALWRYSPVAVYPEKLRLTGTAFVAPETSAAPRWINLDTADDDFLVAETDSAWVAGDDTVWAPSALLTGRTELTHRAADFVDAARHIYRLDADSALTAGYHLYRPPTWVAADGSEEFTRIADALSSGANHVFIRPGIYRERIRLISGVSVIGAGADQTMIQPPGPGAQPGALVQAVGVTGARLSGVTLDGLDLGVDGIHVSQGARSLILSRTIIRGTGTAIHLDGAETELEVVNNTIVQNHDGLRATSCAPLDLRNSVFAYHSGTGLAYDAGCSTPRLHTYNNFWANALDISSGSPGAGDFFLDPLFEDAQWQDFRPREDSPLIDAGNPSDPAPPGTGTRVDVGYLERGRAAFYVDDDYCKGCPNDGLTWQVDAFDRIREALDAAATTLGAYTGAARRPQLTVGVAPGLYTEHVTLPSYVRLVGGASPTSGDEVIIEGGATGTPLSFNGVIHAEARGLTITGAAAAGIEVLGASNAITITRNLIRDNPTGVAFRDQATGVVTFNTLVGNSEHGISAHGQATWALVENNLLHGNAVGLHASSGGQLFSAYNLLNNLRDYEDVRAGEGDLEQIDPRFRPGSYRIDVSSPAVDAASPAAEVPAGGGARADIGYHELPAAPVTLFLGREGSSTALGSAGVAGVEMGVVYVEDPHRPVTETYPTTWEMVALESPGRTLSYWRTTVTPTHEGLHRLYTRATDVVGNREEDPDVWYAGAFVTDATPPEVGWRSPSGGSLLTSPLELRAAVADSAGGAFSVEDIAFVVNGERRTAQWAADPWDPAGAAPRSFRSWLTLSNGTHVAYAVATDKAGNLGQSAPVTFTITGQVPPPADPPALAVHAPEMGSVVTSSVTFRGTASDPHSGIAAVELSLDGGYLWRPARRDGDTWHLEWQLPESREAVSYPVVVRATNHAGVVTERPWRVTVDTVAPTGLDPVIFSAPVGTHFDKPTPLTVTWSAPVDGGGEAFALLAIDRVSDTLPTAPEHRLPGNQGGRLLDLPGAWYVHLGAQDTAGNQFTRHYGPWYVGTQGDPTVPCADRRHAIVIDGTLDLTNAEWRSDEELLDDDERPMLLGTGSGGRQALYATWDGSAFYLGWQGAWWQLDGTLWAYLDTGAGGSDMPVDQGATGPLPFAANYAIQVAGPTDGTLWSFNGQWVAHPLDFASHDSGGLELRLPLDIPQIGRLQLLAFAVDDEGHLWSAFPTTNSLDGDWVQPYTWTDLCGETAPNSGQPRAQSVEMTLASSRSTRIPWSTGQLMTYTVGLANHETAAIADLPLQITASQGLSLQSVDGATCLDCSRDDRVLLDAGPLAAGATHTVTLVARLTDLQGIDRVTLEATLNLISTQRQAGITHRVDALPPSVAVISRQASEVLRPGPWTLWGTADDGAGIGVAYVEVLTGGSTVWERATGTTSWRADVEIPATDVWRLQVRATDHYGHRSDPLIIDYVVDADPPTVSLTLPAYLRGRYAELIGGAADPAPGSRVASVALQLDDPDQPWQSALVYPPDDLGEQRWLYTWALPIEDGVAHRLRARATDGVGNTGPAGDWVTTVIDTVAPELIVTDVITRPYVTPSRVSAPVLTGPVLTGPVLTGTVRDGGGVALVRVRLNLASGESYQEEPAMEGEHWSYTPDPAPLGGYTLWVEAYDEAGNRSVRGPFAIHGYTDPVADAGPDQLVTPHQTVILDGSGSHDPNGQDPLTYLWTQVGGPAVALSSREHVTATFTAPAESTVLTFTLAITNAAGLASPTPDAVTITVAWHRVHLPMIARNHVLAPDLQIDHLLAHEGGVEILIKNVGNAPVTDHFWVDLYVDPDPPPTQVNQIWPDLASQGAVWGVTSGLAPGETLTLTLDDVDYLAAYSQLDLPLPRGTTIYVHVDSANADTTYGAVLESHEILQRPYENNIRSAVVGDRGRSGLAPAPAPPIGDDAGRHLPPRSPAPRQGITR